MAIIATTDPIYFNANNLNSINGWMTTGTDPNRYPNRDVKNFSLAYSDETVTADAFFAGRAVNVSGVIKVSGREALDSSIATLRRILQPINKTLQLPIEGVQRAFYNVTVSNIVISDVAGGYAAINIEFTLSDPHSYNLVNTTVLTALNLTSGIKSYPVTLEGSAKQVPVITYFIDSLTTSTNRTVTFSNPLTGQTLSVQRDWAVGELLIIDAYNKTVKVNGVSVEFTGNFPDWDTGAGFINYTDNFTARQVDINAYYQKRYL